MGIILLLFLPLRVISIFTGFTFTDNEDFAPLLTLVIGLLCVELIRTYQQEKASLPLGLLMLLLSLWPILPNIGLFFLAREFQSVNGYWPQPLVNTIYQSPEPISPQFDRLYSLVHYLEAFSGAWMIIFLALFFTIKSKFSLLQQRMFIGLNLTSLTVLLFDPGNLYAWWLD
jgi:hypothetical protein